MRRREFIATTAVTAAGLMLGRKVSAGNKQNRPNILFIMTDQQHAGMMSCTGNKWLKTPAMDRLATSGIRFEKAFASNPVCVPSRFSLQTGLMPSTIGMGKNEDSAQAAVTQTMVQHSLGRLFRDAGYDTLYGGKVHLPRGMKGIENLGYRNLTRDRRQGLGDTCAEFLKGRHEKPFLLFASFINPHDICYMAINDFNRTQEKAPMGNTDSKTCEAVLDQARKSGDISAFVEANCPPLPANHAVPEAEPECITQNYVNARQFRAHIRKNWTADQWRLHRWAYCRLTEMVDREIGTVLDALKVSGLEDNTLVVFTSDHGERRIGARTVHNELQGQDSRRFRRRNTHGFQRAGPSSDPLRLRRHKYAGRTARQEPASFSGRKRY